jgi:hypothetical protein
MCRQEKGVRFSDYLLLRGAENRSCCCPLERLFGWFRIEHARLDVLRTVGINLTHTDTQVAIAVHFRDSIDPHPATCPRIQYQQSDRGVLTQVFQQYFIRCRREFHTQSVLVFEPLEAPATLLAGDPCDVHEQCSRDALATPGRHHVQIVKKEAIDADPRGVGK